MGAVQAIRDNKATIISGAVVFALVVALFLCLGGPRRAQGAALVALVHDGDGATHELPLDKDTTLTVTTSLGTNVIEVSGGTVRMADASCPNRTCLEVPALGEPGGQIICLPNRLWIEVVEAGSAGGEMDVSLAETPQDGIDLVAR